MSWRGSPPSAEPDWNPYRSSDGNPYRAAREAAAYTQSSGAYPGAPWPSVQQPLCPSYAAGPCGNGTRPTTGLPCGPASAVPGQGGGPCSAWGAGQPRRRARALLVGVNYTNTRCELRGCYEDVRRMRSLLVDQFGFADGDIVAMLDSPGALQPTRAGILAEASRLAGSSQLGDVLVFHFSGHGAQVTDPHGMEEDGLNEVVLPCDWFRAGMITDDELSRALVDPLPSGVRLVAIMDCCHAGTGLDLPFVYEGWGWREDTNPCFSRGDVVLFSGCEDHDVSAETSALFSARPCGAMTTAFCDSVLRGRHSHASLLEAIGGHLRQSGYSQRPVLSASQRFAPDRPFSLSPGGAMPNTNPRQGRLQRKRFHASRSSLHGPLAETLAGAGIGLAAGYLAVPLLAHAFTPVPEHMALGAYSAPMYPSSDYMVMNSLDAENAAPHGDWFGASDSTECPTM